MSGNEIPWLQPLRAAIAGEAGRPTVLALATVDAAGDPQVRSMVCRRVDQLGRLWMVSDSRSAKHEQIVRHPRAAAVAWFPSSRQQFRFSGSIAILDDFSEGSHGLDLWHSLVPETRATFFWPVPGQPREAPYGSFSRFSNAPRPPPSFEILLLTATHVECLSLACHPHQRLRWERERAWGGVVLNP